MTKKIAVILSGSGYLDGSEITEAVSSLICLSKHGVDYDCYAPNMEVSEMDHICGEETGQKINILKESARISRGNIKGLAELKPENYDGLLMPGGFGAAKNLSDFATRGADGRADDRIAKIIKEFHSQSKPIAAFCIAPAVVALVLGSKGIDLTIGNDEATAEAIQKTGANHVECKVDDFVTDRENKIITSPAYMYDAKPFAVFSGIDKAVSEFVEMA